MAQQTRAETLIAAPPAAVFPWLYEPERIARWVGGTVECRAMGDGALCPGGRLHQVVDQAGRRLDIDIAIAECDPPSRLVLDQAISGLFDMTLTQELEERDGGTFLVTSLSAELRSIAARLAAPLVAPQVKAKLADDLARLKALVEAER
jgi:uncharacterized protein YndB with AHSA1/START domain